MKFPIYRLRGTGPPDVQDDIKKLWEATIKPKGAFEGRKSTSLFSGSQDELTTVKERDRAYSLMRSKAHEDRSTLKIAGSQTIVKPKRRERFNENTEDEISL